MRAVIITGASTGIGHDSARTLSQRGFLVFAGVRKTADLSSFDGLSNVVPILIDVANLESVRSAKTAIERELISRGTKVREWSLVNNAGVVVSGPVEGLTDQQWQEQFDVNVFGLLRTTREFLPRIRETRGYIINVGSVSGLITAPFLTPYCASKYAVEAISDGLRRELGGLGVRVVLLEPGPIQTPIWKKNLGEKEKKIQEMPAEVMNVYGASIRKMEKMIEHSAGRAVPVSVVSEAITTILSQKRPRTRLILGAPQVKFQVGLFRFLSDRVGDKLMSLGTRQ